MDAAQDRSGPETQDPGSEVRAEGSAKEIPEGQEIDFVTMGMVIIDEIEFPPPRPPAVDVLGGAGTYSALGARLFSPPPLSRTVGWIVDQGSDFPSSITSLISSWETSALLRLDNTRLTTRGWNGYTSPSDPSHRSFRYTTPKKRLTSTDLLFTPLLHARTIHLICSPTRCRELIPTILSHRKKSSSPLRPYTRPLFVWEPVPDLCTPSELLNLTNTLPLVDICSPNHAELASFMGCSPLDPETNQISTVQVERACEQLLSAMPLQSYSLVIRAGEKGCYLARNGGRRRNPKLTAKAKPIVKAKPKKEYFRGGLQPDTDMFSLFANLMQDPEGHIAREEIEVDPGTERWFPAYFEEGEGEKVVDPTGGGNTFLGGLAVALARGKELEEACCWGSVAASFAIEQVGMPVLGKGEDGEEVWNGEGVGERLERYLRRVEVEGGM